MVGMSKPAAPKPNAPNTLAWTRPLGTPAPKPTKAPKFNPWTTPLPVK